MRDTRTVWPEEVLGCPLRSEYRGSSDAFFARTDIQDGPARYRRVHEEERRTYDVTFLWSMDQMTAWESWHHYYLDNGMRWFQMPNLTGDGMESWYCHMIEGWEVTPHPDRVDRVLVKFSVEAYHGPTTVPPLLVLQGSINAGPVNAPSPVAYDALTVLDARPGDNIDALVPGAIP
jgi:hypothetical protein